ncbi:MAG: hypothetical protein K9K93_07520 [Acholeplasmataceae bacterium]|nr:hypothetical protein [Acholeplasmataceae bacterium]
MDLKKIRNKQRFYLISIITVITLLVLSLILIYSRPWSSDIKITLTFLVVIILLVAALYYSPRVYYVNQIAAFTKLKTLAEGPLKAKFNPLSATFYQRLLKKSFVAGIDYGPFVILNRYTKGSGHPATKEAMLEIIILIKDPLHDVDSPLIQKAINQIEDDYQKQKVRFKNYSIITIKSKPSWTKEEQREIENVTFDRQGAFKIAVARVLYASDDDHLYVLHSRLYAPSIQYDYVIKLLIELIA